MSKTSSAVKYRYSKNTYDRYEIRVDKDTELAHKLIAETNIAGLIKNLLCDHYGVILDQMHNYHQLL